MTTNLRYRQLKQHKGVRQDIRSGKYLVQKSVHGKRVSKSFHKLKDALLWQSTFDPTLNSISESLQGPDLTFLELWERYRDEHLVACEKSTFENRLGLAKKFERLFPIPVKDITPMVISEFISTCKKESIIKCSHRRIGFDQELKLLRSIFNWYRELFDHTFANPIMRSHKKLGILVQKKNKDKKLSLEELKKFFEALKLKPFWFDFAITQLFMAGRVQEVAGLQKCNVNFKGRTILVKDVVVWRNSDKKFDYLKSEPKNGEIRIVAMNDFLNEALLRRFSETTSETSYVFSINGEPLTYRQIQYNYELALRQAGLDHKYSGTHILRHSMATLARRITGSLEATQAITGHRDQKLVQHYAALDDSVNREAQMQIQKFLITESFL